MPRRASGWSCVTRMPGLTIACTSGPAVRTSSVSPSSPTAPRPSSSRSRSLPPLPVGTTFRLVGSATANHLTATIVTPSGTKSVTVDDATHATGTIGVLINPGATVGPQIADDFCASIGDMPVSRRSATGSPTAPTPPPWDCRAEGRRSWRPTAGGNYLLRSLVRPLTLAIGHLQIGVTGVTYAAGSIGGQEGDLCHC